MNVLVVGGAGYIGSHMVSALTDAGHSCVVLDNLSTGYREVVANATFVEADMCDAAVLDALFNAHRIDAVMHFASFIQVAESVRTPGRYYRNDVCGTLGLLEAMVRADVRRLVFSSTAAIFGEPEYVPIDEGHPQRPISPYGVSKWMVERILRDYDFAHAMKSVCLRYFNAAGAHPSGVIGERHEPETHLIPLLLQAASGRRENVSIFGRDYETPDGTCIRDYIHVLDLCQAHLLALQWLCDDEPSAAFNLWIGNRHSVLEVIGAVERVTGRHVPVIAAPRRSGDPARLVADSRLIQSELGWRPRCTGIDGIVRDAWAFEQSFRRV